MKDLNYYLNLPYKITIEKISKNEGGRYSATMPEFKGVALFWGDGESKKEALQELKIAFKSTLIALLKANITIPKPE